MNGGLVGILWMGWMGWDGIGINDNGIDIHVLGLEMDNELN